MTVWLQIWGMILHGLFAQALPFPGPGAGGVQPPPLSGMQVWYEADVGNNCGGACTDGANQTTWADQSGNGNTGHGDGTLAIASVQPNCIAGVYHTNQINGKPAVTFNLNASTPTCFAVPTHIDISTAASGFVVMKTSAGCTIGINLNCNLMGGGGSSLNWSSGAATAQPGLAKACVTNIGNSSATPGTNWVQMGFTYNASTGAYAFRVSRAAAGSGTNAQTISSTTGYLGVGGNGCSANNLHPYGGQIAEWILYNRVLSGAEITTVETYLNAKYGL